MVPFRGPNLDLSVNFEPEFLALKNLSVQVKVVSSVAESAGTIDVRQNYHESPLFFH